MRWQWNWHAWLCRQIDRRPDAGDWIVLFALVAVVAFNVYAVIEFFYQFRTICGSQ